MNWKDVTPQLIDRPVYFYILFQRNACVICHLFKYGSNYISVKYKPFSAEIVCVYCVSKGVFAAMWLVITHHVIPQRPFTH